MFRLVSGNAANGAEKMAEADEVEERRFQSRKGMEADNGSKDKGAEQSINQSMAGKTSLHSILGCTDIDKRKNKKRHGRKVMDEEWRG